MRKRRWELKDSPCDCIKVLPETCPFCRKSLIYYGLGGQGVINHEHKPDLGTVIVTCDHCLKQFSLTEEHINAQYPDWKDWPPENPVEYKVLGFQDMLDDVGPGGCDIGEWPLPPPDDWRRGVEYAKGFTITDSDETEDWITSAISEACRRIAEAQLHSMDHAAEGTECTPACPKYVAPAPPDEHPLCGECGRPLDDDDWEDD